MRKVLLLLIALFISIIGYAYDAEVGGIYFNLIPKVNKAEVTFKNNNYYSYSGSVTIPERDRGQVPVTPQEMLIPVPDDWSLAKDMIEAGNKFIEAMEAMSKADFDIRVHGFDKICYTECSCSE